MLCGEGHWYSSAPSLPNFLIIDRQLAQSLTGEAAVRLPSLQWLLLEASARISLGQSWISLTLAVLFGRKSPCLNKDLHFGFPKSQ